MMRHLVNYHCCSWTLLFCASCMMLIHHSSARINFFILLDAWLHACYVFKEKDGKSYGSRKESKKSRRHKEKLRRKNKDSRYSSSDDEGLERIKSGSRKKKKWYDSNEDLSSSSDGSVGLSEEESKRHKIRKGEKKKHDDSFDNEYKSKSKKKSKSRVQEYSSESSGSGSARCDEERGHHREGMKRSKNKEEWDITSEKMENALMSMYYLIFTLLNYLFTYFCDIFWICFGCLIQLVVKGLNHKTSTICVKKLDWDGCFGRRIVQMRSLSNPLLLNQKKLQLKRYTS